MMPIARRIAATTDPMTIPIMSFVDKPLLDVSTRGTDCAIVEFRHSRKVVFKFDGRGVSAISLDTVDVFDEGILMKDPAVLLYPSKLRRNDEAR